MIRRDLRIEASEDDDACHVTAGLSSMREQDLDVTFADNTPTISGENPARQPDARTSEFRATTGGGAAPGIRGMCAD